MRRFFTMAFLLAALTPASLSTHAQGTLPSGQNGPPQAVTLPEGIDHIYAMEGSDDLLLFGTQAGYETTRELVKALDGDLALMRTEVTYARATPGFLSALGVAVGPDGSLSAQDVQTLVDARRQGKFAGTDTLRITSREEYETEGTVGGGASALPLTEATEINAEGQIQVRLTQPAHATITLRPGEMSVVALPPNGANAPISLLFLTASVVSEEN